jgi:uncharacterized membrane protein (UPF0136 family)
MPYRVNAVWRFRASRSELHSLATTAQGIFADSASRTIVAVVVPSTVVFDQVVGTIVSTIGHPADVALRIRRNHMGVAEIYFLVFGILTIAGGIVGYIKAGSAASIFAGFITGVWLIVAGLLIRWYPGWGLGLGLVVSLLLAAQFIPKFVRTGRFMPAGIMALLSAIGILIAVAVWLGK